jgi:cytochrome c-type biogenesis protein CcmH/NrfG
MFTLENQSDKADGVAAQLLGVSRTIAFVVFGFLPLFFIPYFFAPLGYTKVVVTTFALLIAAILFAFSVLRQGSVRAYFDVPLILMWVSFGVATISSFFSQDFFDSFLGTEITPHSGVFMGVLALTATVWMCIGAHKKTVLRLYLLLAASALALAVFHLFRIIFGADMLSFKLFGDAASTPFGEWNGLAIFFGLVVILSLLAIEQLTLRLAGRIMFGVVVVASLIMLAIINFKAVFFVLGIVSLMMILYALTKGHLKSSRVALLSEEASSFPVIISLVTLAVSIVFIIGGPAVGSMVSRATGISYIEVRPSFQATVGIAKEVYKESPILGVGPNRFADAWREHRDASINTTIFWNTNFQAGFGYLPTLFVTGGLIGGLVWMIFLGWFTVLGTRTLLRPTQNTDTVWYFVTFSSFVASLYLWGMSLLYVPGPVLLLLAAACTGIFLSARRTYLAQSGSLFSVADGLRVTFVTVGATVLLVVASVGSLYYMSRYYVATAMYADAFADLSQGGSQEAAIAQMMRAFEISQDDLFARQVAAYEQARLQEKVVATLSETTADDVDQNDLQQSVLASVNNAQTAVGLDSTDPENHALLGRVYATAVPLNIPEAYDLARQSLERARDLDPQNPSRLLALGELELLKGNRAPAREYVNQAIALKQNYTDAIYMLTQIEIADGNVAAAITSTQALTFLESNNPVRFFQLGVLQYNEKRNAEAAKSFEQAIILSPDYSNARYFLAFVYDALNRKGDAATQLQEVLARNPDNEEVKALILALSQNGALPQPTNTAAGREPISESSEGAPDQGSATSGSAPDSRLLSPVNEDTTAE